MVRVRKYTEAVKWDGAVVLDEGELMTVEAIVAKLNTMEDKIASTVIKLDELADKAQTPYSYMHTELHNITAELRDGEG